METNETTKVADISDANTDIICPNCGDRYLTCDRSKILTSNPPKYKYYCKGCGFSHNAYPDAEMRAWIKHLDVVNHPPHYESGKFECIDVMRETQGDEAVQNFCICNAMKYIYRHRNKNGVEDIRKAKWYIDKFLEIEEGKNARSDITIHR